MNVAAVVLPHEDSSTEVTRIVYQPDEDNFLIQQGDEITNSLDCPVQTEIKLSLPQFVQLFDTLNDERFMDAMMMVRNDFTRKTFN